jgi:hypothetical protein
MFAIAFVQVACSDNDIDNGVLDAPVAVAVTFNVTLTTTAQTPVCTAAGATATGTATVVVSADRSTITVTSLTVSGLSGPVTAAEIHVGAPGVSGPVIFSIGTNFAAPLHVTFTAANYPVNVPAGAPATFNDFVAQLLAGNVYITVFTAACPNGEIRAQLR